MDAILALCIISPLFVAMFFIGNYFDQKAERREKQQDEAEKKKL